ncbi:TetR/AcrR family transcriptional regulator [Nocardia mexicana]|uniref:TetR family transcriptional regulator n=1 Tax=Nocardia mexicana TaxID=279262 RepID=A0A370H254_9NOCA|nr:TetR/AcrR family transcriptional regulator [Nocardia mexicana]RDI49917.1 TetR family transcriptional regulator [Nocardia mexicana]
MRRSPLLARALDAPGGVDATDERILESALEQFTLVGIRRTSGDDIARRVGMNRTTLYRRMGTKDDIVRAAMMHETRRVLARLDDELSALDDATEQVLHSFVFAVSALRSHPLLRQLLTADRDDTLAWVTVHAGPVVDMATAFLADLIGENPGTHQDPGTAHATAAILVRFVQSLVLTPTGAPDLTTDEQLRHFADQHIRPLITRK